MFSINPSYEYRGGDSVDFGSENYAVGGVDERSALYRRCEAEGVGISVMKPFSGGQLLSDRTSPFGKALTEYQCMQYALDKPGISWPAGTTLSWRKRPGTVSGADIVTDAARSMYLNLNVCGKLKCFLEHKHPQFISAVVEITKKSKKYKESETSGRFVHGGCPWP